MPNPTTTLRDDASFLDNTLPPLQVVLTLTCLLAFVAGVKAALGLAESWVSVAKVLLAVFVATVTVEHLLKVVVCFNAWPLWCRPSYHLGRCRDHLWRAFATMGQYAAFVSSFIELLRLHDVVDTAVELVDPIFAIAVSWVAVPLGYYHYLELSSVAPGTLLLGSLLILALLAVVYVQALPYLSVDAQTWCQELHLAVYCALNKYHDVGDLCIRQ